MKMPVIEDDPDVLHSLGQILTDEGYLVDTADNGEDGLYRAENAEYDAIVLDVMPQGRAGKR